MKRWLCAIFALLLMTGAALADENARVKVDVLDFSMENCRISSQSDGAAVSFAWSVETAEGAQESYFMDVGRIAVSSGADSVIDWQMMLNPMEESNLVMVLLSQAGRTLGSNGTVKIKGEPEFPLQIAFSVDFYEAVAKTSDLDLRNQRWRMVQSETDGEFVEARPDLPHLNDNSNTPKVLTDFDALVRPGESWEEQLAYVREHAALKRIVAQIYELARHMGAYEVMITFENADQPGNIQIAKVN